MIKHYDFEIYINRSNNIAIKQRDYGDGDQLVEIDSGQLDGFIACLQSVASTLEKKAKAGRPKEKNNAG
jgi:hypothetical protein